MKVVTALRAIALHLVALEATKWLAGLRHPQQSAVWTFDSLDLAGNAGMCTTTVTVPHSGS